MIGNRFVMTATAALFAVALALPQPAAAVDTREPVTTPATKAAPAAKSAPAEKKEGFFTRMKKKFTKTKKEPKKEEKKSDNLFLDRYRAAHDLIYKNKDYAAGIVALRALKRDDNPDVANLIGFSSRKLGRYDDAKVWYEKALVADAGHTRTWQYYGLWHLEQGNRLKAEEHLAKIQTICGTECEDYKSLQLALAGGGSSY
jgi:tetratricopeptide (TPR) repeat protein